MEEKGQRKSLRLRDDMSTVLVLRNLLRKGGEGGFDVDPELPSQEEEEQERL